MANILIIGGSGCVGTETIQALIARGNDKIICLSRGFTAIHPIQNVAYVQADILHRDSLLSVLHDFSVTHILHSAALRTTECQHSPSRAVEINITGTGNVLEAARLFGNIQRLVFTSTAAVYKVPENGGLVDEKSATVPLNLYTATKLAAEILVESYAINFNIPATILRPQIIYGPTRGTDGSTAGVSQAMRLAAEGKSFTIPFGGKTGFHFSRDVGQQHALALQESPEHFACYNLPAESLSVADICSIINDHYGKPLIDFIDTPYPFAEGLISAAYLNAFPDSPHTSFFQALHEVSIQTT